MKKVVQGYGEWLRALNYDENNNKSGIKKIENFLSFIDENKIKNIDEIDQKIIQKYFENLSKTKSKITKTALSNNTLISCRREIKRFARYLLETGKQSFEVKIEIPKSFNHNKVIFTIEEIEKMYASCKNNLLGIRDKAMLSVYYGCGLRRNEGANLAIKDVQFERGILHIRKGKNYKERFVPMTAKVILDLMEYSMQSRPKLSNDRSGNSFFVSYRGEPLGASSMGNRFNKIKTAAEINKNGSLHNLRHSIATHLLEKGMKLEQIAKFLGHNCIESTQIYTHLIND